MSVKVAGEEVVLETAGAPIEELGMNPFQSFLHLLSDPNIAFILFTLGFYGIFFELQNPNYVTGILGAFALILAFIGFGSLPLNIAGLLLIALAVILFVLELSVTSGGLLTVGGLVAFALGASALYTQPGDPVAPEVSVAPEVIAVMTVLTASSWWASSTLWRDNGGRHSWPWARHISTSSCRSARTRRYGAPSIPTEPSTLRVRSGPPAAPTAASLSEARPSRSWATTVSRSSWHARHQSSRSSQ